jgi:LAO/AO transport system kinase
LEAAGFDVILIETVGVGQSEVTVSQMVDTFAFLTLARTGDQLQGIKKGVLELADVVAVNKADGDHLVDARVAARELGSALRLIHPRGALWRPPVLTMSALTGNGVTEFWEAIERHAATLTEAGEFARRRQQQQVDWTWAMVRDAVWTRFERADGVRSVRSSVEDAVRSGGLTPTLAAQRLLSAYDGAARE